jgi:hypothetical protein
MQSKGYGSESDHALVPNQSDFRGSTVFIKSNQLAANLQNDADCTDKLGPVTSNEYRDQVIRTSNMNGTLESEERSRGEFQLPLSELCLV